MTLLQRKLGLPAVFTVSIDAISARVRGSDLVVLGASPGGIGPELSDRISEVTAPVLTVHAPDRGQRTLVERALQKLIY